MSPTGTSAIDWVKLIVALEPALLALAPVGKDIINLFTKHPNLTPALLAEIFTALHSANADTRATNAADSAAHPGGL